MVDFDGVAHAAYDALERGDVEGFRGLFTDNSGVWYNYSRKVRYIDALAASFHLVVRSLPDLRYESRRYLSLPDGALVQHVMVGTTTQSRPVAIEFLTRMYMNDDGLIRWVDDYLDPAQNVPLFDAMQAAGDLPSATQEIDPQELEALRNGA